MLNKYELQNESIIIDLFSLSKFIRVFYLKLRHVPNIKANKIFIKKSRVVKFFQLVD
jgi:hypothetical protein